MICLGLGLSLVRRLVGWFVGWVCGEEIDVLGAFDRGRRHGARWRFVGLMRKEVGFVHGVVIFMKGTIAWPFLVVAEPGLLAEEMFENKRGGQKSKIKTSTSDSNPAPPFSLCPPTHSLPPRPSQHDNNPVDT